MHTLIAFSEEVPASTAQQELEAVPDEHVHTEGDVIYAPTLSQIGAIFAIGTGIQNVQVFSPFLASVFQEDVSPLNVGDLPELPPYPIDKFDCPLQVVPDDGIMTYSGNSDGVNANQESVLLWMCGGPAQKTGGRVHTLRATGAILGNSYNWESVRMTLSQVLPAGAYDLVGARVENANLIAFRFVFVGGTWRPGGIANPDCATADWQRQRFGNMGVWGSFLFNQPPTLQVFGDGTPGDVVIFLDLMKKA